MDKTQNANALINKNSYRVILNKVYYKDIYLPKDLPEDTVLKLKIRDSYRVLNITDKRLEAEFRREYYFEPKAMFEIEVIMIIQYKINEQQEEINRELIEEQFKKDIDALIRPAASHCSVIVSALTNVNFKTPIVGPPFLVTDKDNYE